MTGSSTATVASIGSMSYPELKKHGYFPGLSLAALSAGGTLGILIPPSLGMVFYAIVTEQSIGKLFIAGILPGILLASLFCLASLAIALIKPELAPRGADATWAERIAALPKMSVIPIIFVIIIGGIYTGVYTPTEAAGCATAFVLVAMIVARRFSWKGVLASLVRAGQLTAMVLTIIAGGIFYARFLVLTDAMPRMIGFITGLGVGPETFLLSLIPIYIVLGMFLDIYGMMIVSLPIVFPITRATGDRPDLLRRLHHRHVRGGPDHAARRRQHLRGRRPGRQGSEDGGYLPVAHPLLLCHDPGDGHPDLLPGDRPLAGLERSFNL